MAQKRNFDDQNAADPAERIRGVIADCMQRRADGESVSDESVIDAHPELMPELAAELRKLQLIEAARIEACSDEEKNKEANDHEMLSGLHIRCPNCHNPVEITLNRALTVIDCDCCGNRLRLAQDETKDYKTTLGTKLGHFELTEKIGVGGFGTVFKARDTELDRIVAVKVPRKSDLEPSEIEQFLREARIAAQLKHPNIARIHEIGREDDTIFIVCDFVNGVLLSDWMTRRLTHRESAELCEKIARALHYAHETGVVHRDLKPANIIINAKGEPCILDFGLAKRDTGEVTVTLDGQVLGTPAYMSPEQAMGQAHQSDRRSDVYSLGVILFELLTGELPFRGNERMLICQVINDEPSSPRKFNANVPRDLETICLKCLEKAPQRRYASAKAMADDLGAWLAGEPITARPIGNTERAWRWCRRKPAFSALGTTTVVLLAAIGLLATLAYFREARLRSGTQDALEQERFLRNALIASSDWQQRIQAVKNVANLPKMQELANDMINDRQLHPLIDELNDLQFHGKKYGPPQMRFQNHPARTKYQEVFNGLLDPNDPNLPVWSWFATGPNGLQLLRRPDNDTIGRNFARRTYFTGESRDYKNPRDYFDNSPRNHLGNSYHVSVVMQPEDTELQVVVVSSPVEKKESSSELSAYFLKLRPL